MELVFAACCFVFPVWALSLQSYEGDHEDDFDFLWKLWLDTAIKILLSLQINGLLYGGVLVLKRGLFVLRAFSLRYHCGISILATPWDLDGIPRWGRTQRRAINAVFIPSSLRQGDVHAVNLTLANIAEAMGHTIEVHLKSYARFKPNATAELIAAVNV